LKNVLKTYKLLIDYEGEVHDPESELYTGYTAFGELSSHAEIYYQDAKIPEGMKMQEKEISD